MEAPNFVIEIRSKNCSLAKLKIKMEKYINNGVQLEWLLDSKYQQG